jgi:plasmid replication initiation protein
MKKELVVKDNALINASYHLSLVEQRLILLAIVEARKTKTPSDRELSVPARAYAQQFGVTQDAAYTALKEACEHLFERRFSYQKLTPKGNIKVVKSRWVQRVAYVDKEAWVQFKFSDDVIPLITQLEKHFTSYELEQVSSLTSGYAVRLYELLIAWRSKGKTPIINLEELRNKLGLLAQEHIRSDNFKRFVLDIAITQINTHTNITVTYEQYKAGRVITGFSFNFKKKSTGTIKNDKIGTKERKRKKPTQSLRQKLTKEGISL